MRVDLPVSQALSDYADSAVARIKAAAEAARGQMLTPGSGKSMEYAAKRREAERFAITGDPEGLHMLQGYARGAGLTVDDAAAVIRQRAEEVAQAGGLLAELEEAGTRALRAAQTHAEVGRVEAEFCARIRAGQESTGEAGQ